VFSGSRAPIVVETGCQDFELPADASADSDPYAVVDPYSKK
jgi:hypothetical protein